MDERRQRQGWWFLGAAVPLFVLFAFLLDILPDHALVVPRGHFIVVTLISVLSFVIAALVLAAAVQIADVRVLALALAIVSLSGLFAIHGLATPGVIAPGVNGWVGASARLALFGGSWFLAASALESPIAVHRTLLRYRGWIALGTALLLVAYGSVAVSDLVLQRAAATEAGARLSGLRTLEQLATTIGGGRTALVLGLASLALSLLAFAHYWRVARRWATPLVWGLLGACPFLVQAGIALLLAPVWHLSWWEYHVLLLAGSLAALSGLVREYARSGSWRGVLEGLLLRDALEHLERGSTEVVAALAAAVEAEDSYTKEHSVRVARLAASIAQELGLPPERERILYQAGILHDIGKIGIPDAILQKPGRLTAEEFALVREHPVRSWEIARQIRSFAPMLPAIRWHHERLDGSGHPDGLRGEEIPLDARILAVADVFDALTSVRPYRAALSVEEALALLRQEAGTRLDVECVAALERLVEQYGVSLVGNERETMQRARSPVEPSLEHR
ncbi:HD-GYP domain-containing protein [Thermomicrobium sp. 4228-Ro]|uniref:HD-GYP domain-containing protein n=1 Tax=Thermomicrobium sp. 4228-Ro TaxID=2993937 RepID=UPI0022492D87|nr:HD-GYP domain-containing protein [Thermomicrobium sp. 4228-Ro]MCX2726793.1 HD-GYP domain-containing protein [Thermomicrobium sp. 4228-Ro]